MGEKVSKKGFMSMYTVRDVVLMGALIAVSGVFKGFWGIGRAQIEAVVGPLIGPVFSVGFYMWGVLAAVLIGKVGVGTIVMVPGTFIELAVGNPYGALVFVYNFIEGLAADVGAVFFRYKLNRFSKVFIASVVALVFGSTIFLAWLGVARLPTQQFPDAPLYFLLGWYYFLAVIGGIITGVVVWGISKLLSTVGFKGSELKVES
ncbi:MAG: ECF transporter S component [Nitrososphaeria archaeon]